MKKIRLVFLLSILLLALSMASPAIAQGMDDGILTRGEFVSELFGLSGAEGSDPVQSSFVDVPDGGALAQAVGWAADRGIVNGYGDGRFGPDDPVTLEQMVTMLYRDARCLGQAPEGEWLFPLGFSDAGEIAGRADEAMQ